MRHEARIIKACRLDESHAHGSFVAPHLIELKSAAQLTREEFGPILHVVRYRSADIAKVLAAIRATHYGLTLGVQTRLESFWRAGVREHLHRQYLRQPQHDRRRGRRAAVRRQRACPARGPRPAARITWRASPASEP